MEYEKTYGHRQETCPVSATQEVMVGLPVEVKPFAEIGKVKTQCMGRPIIRRGTTQCEGKHKETCKFTISQKIRVEVPVIFGAKTEIGSAKVDCGCSKQDDTDLDDKGIGCMNII